MIIFSRDRDLVSLFFVSDSVWDSRDWNLSVKSLRSSVVFGGTAPAPLVLPYAFRTST